MTFILPFGQAHGDQAWRTGPKAARLSELSAAGFRVPPGYAITTDALAHFLASNDLTEEVSAALKHFDALRFDQLGDKPARLRERIASGTLPDDLANELRRTLDELGNAPVALRSSSTLEDRADFSFAGQHDSYLNLQTFDECATALIDVWTSLYSDRALAYLRALDRSTQPLQMGVVLQTLVPAQVAGVAFTVHPVSGDYDQVYISAALGLGEGTVSGAVTPDEILVGRTARNTLSYTTGAKASKIVAAATGGTQQVAVAAEDQQAQALDEAQIGQVVELALKVEELMGSNPQDVEWALCAGELFLLQARPMIQAAQQGISWQAPIPGSNWRRNWRLGEWLPEAVTPLFSSWVLPMLVAARENFGTGRLGWKHRPAFSMPHPWFCIVNGYFYTRQDFPNWGKDEKEQTEAEKRAERLERMAGGKQHLRNWHGQLLPAYVEHFAQHNQGDLTTRSGRELLDFVETLAEEAGEIWFIIAPIGYGFEVMGFKPHYEEKIPEEGRVHYSALFSGYPSRIFDAQQALYELSLKVREQQGLAEKLLGETPTADLPAWLAQSLETYAAEYGHQLASLDFFWPTSGEDQAQLCQTLGVFASRDIEAPEAQRQRTATRRDESVAAVLAQLADDEDEHNMMAALIDYYQTNASVREDANFYFQLGWPLMRGAVLELASRLLVAGVLEEADAVFFLEKEELQGAVAALEGDATPSSLQQVAAGRRHTWQEQRQLDAPDKLGAQEEQDPSEKGYFDDDEGRRIIAQGVSPGLCRGRVRIARAGDTTVALEKGEVLVTHAASPQLTPLMLMAGALVVEVGGGASHSSLVARELGLPALVDAPQAMQVLKDGMLVEVDGAHGVLRIIKE